MFNGLLEIYRYLHGTRTASLISATLIQINRTSLSIFAVIPVSFWRISVNRKWLFLVSVMLVGLLQLAPSITSAASACSISSTALINMTFVNNTGSTIDIYWVDFNCNEVLYFASVSDGQSVPQSTFPTHPWLARDSKTGDLLYCFVATVDGTEVFTAGVDHCQLQPDHESVEIGCQAAYDGRINNSLQLDCAPPVAIYKVGDQFDVYGIDPTSGQGVLLMSIVPDELGDAPVVNTLLTEALNESTGQSIRLWYLSSGELQINTAYADGKPFVFLFGLDGKMISHPAS